MAIPEYVDMHQLKATADRLKDMPASRLTPEEVKFLLDYDKAMQSIEMTERINRRNGVSIEGNTATIDDTTLGTIHAVSYETGYRFKNIGRNRKERRALKNVVAE